MRMEVVLVGPIERLFTTYHFCQISEFAIVATILAKRYLLLALLVSAVWFVQIES